MTYVKENNAKLKAMAARTTPNHWLRKHNTPSVSPTGSMMGLNEGQHTRTSDT